MTPEHQFFGIGVTGQGKSFAAQFIQETLNGTWTNDEPDRDREIVIVVETNPGDEPVWKRFQEDVRKLIDRYGNDLAIAAYGFDVPEIIDGSVVPESRTLALDSVPRRNTEAQ